MTYEQNPHHDEGDDRAQGEQPHEDQGADHGYAVVDCHGSADEEPEQVGAGEHAYGLAVLDDENRVGVLKFGTRDPDRLAGADERQARLHVPFD